MENIIKYANDNQIRVLLLTTPTTDNYKNYVIQTPQYFNLKNNFKKLSKYENVIVANNNNNGNGNNNGNSSNNGNNNNRQNNNRNKPNNNAKPDVSICAITQPPSGGCVLKRAVSDSF